MPLLKIKKVDWIESPQFEERDPEDGSTYVICVLLIVAVDIFGVEWQLNKVFEGGYHWLPKEEATEFVEKVAKRGIINPEYWSEGTAWDQYKEPQTYQEEKNDYYDKKDDRFLANYG